MTFKEQFNGWIDKLNKSENPPLTISAFNFGLFETEDGFTVYLIGAKKFDAGDDDWATEVDYEPKDKYLAIDPHETKGLEWDKVLEKVKLTVENYVNTDDFKGSILKHAKAVTTGFDDGELLRIK